MGKKRPATKQETVHESKRHKVHKKSAEKIEEQHSEPEKAPEKSKKKAEKAQDLNFFSQSFYDKLEDFQTLYRDFLHVKTNQSEGDINSQLQDVTSRVSTHIQDEASSIFKHQLQDLQSWIEGEIKRIEEDIKSIEQVYELNRDSLLKTGAFSEDQVRKQLAPIQAKVQSKKENRQKFQQLINRSKEIYA